VCDIAVPAHRENLPVVRRRLRGWLAATGCPEETAEEVLLAVNEAVTNAVEHAYPPGVPVGPVQVAARVEDVDPHPGAGGLRSTGRRVRVWVRDRGRWQPDVHDRSDVLRRRGRGLVVMQGLMAEVLLVHDAASGTEVELVSEPWSADRPAHPG
jgi:anti-sigma regulatory factor (Ser/Thr protein kinase)